MTTLTIILGILCFLLCGATIALYAALAIAVDERETWYTPIKPIEFDYLDGEVEDADR